MSDDDPEHEGERVHVGGESAAAPRLQRRHAEESLRAGGFPKRLIKNILDRGWAAATKEPDIEKRSTLLEAIRAANDELSKL
jgi:hypothetical protein